jgi:hypothetical protein
MTGMAGTRTRGDLSRRAGEVGGGLSLKAL